MVKHGETLETHRNSNHFGLTQKSVMGHLPQPRSRSSCTRITATAVTMTHATAATVLGVDHDSDHDRHFNRLGWCLRNVWPLRLLRSFLCTLWLCTVILATDASAVILATPATVSMTFTDVFHVLAIRTPAF